MKLLLFKLFLFISLPAFADVSEPCSYTEFEEQVMSLAKDLDRVNDHSLKALIETSIYEVCEKAPRVHNISTNPAQKKLRFTIFSDTYDPNLPYYFCKNKSGYEAYLWQLQGRIKNELAEEKQTASRQSYENNRAINSSASIASTSEPTQTQRLWRCTVPGYVTTVRTVNESQKYGLEETYNVSCEQI